LTIALTLVVRFYDGGSLGDADRRAAVAVASELLRGAAIETTWPQCPAPRPLPRPSVTAPQDAFTC